MFFSKILPSFSAKGGFGFKSSWPSKDAKDCNPFDKDDDDKDHGRDWGWGKDHGRDWGHGGGKGHGWFGGKDCDRDDDDSDDGDTGSGFPEIPKDTTGITFHVDLTDDDQADEYFYVQKGQDAPAAQSFEDYWKAVKADLDQAYPDRDPKDIVIKATIYSASKGESYYYFTGDEESDDGDDGDDDDDKDCGKWGRHGHKGRDHDRDDDHDKGHGCKVVAKAHSLKDLLDQKFCADLSRDDVSFDDDDKDDDDDHDDDDDKDC